MRKKIEFKNPRLRVIKIWCQKILNGLKYLHESKPPIIHRDIKCENIFISRNTGEVKIGDLGLSVILKEEEYAKTFCGTLEFCSPEVYKGKYGVKADIYSFGMSVLEMITGEKPYEECQGQIITICEKVKNKIMPNSLSKIKNQKVYNFILKCLQPEEKRPSASELLIDPFLNDLESDENNYPVINNFIFQNRLSKSFISLQISKRNDNEIVHLKFNYKQNKNYTKSFVNLLQLAKEDIRNIDIESNLKINQNDLKYIKNEQTGKLQINTMDETGILFKVDEEEKSTNEIGKIVLFKRDKGKVKSQKFNFIFSQDTVQNTINELAKTVNLSNEERKICEEKLSEFLENMKNHLEEEIEKKTNIFNEGYDSFCEQFDRNLKEIEEITEIYQEIKANPSEFIKEEIEEIEKKLKKLFQIKQ